MSSGQKMLTISPGPRNMLAAEVMDTLDYTKGDVAFLDDDPDRIFQIRPILATDMFTNRPYTAADRMLVGRANGKVFFRGFVRLPFHARKNTPANVQLAFKKLEEFNSNVAKQVREWGRNGGLPGHDSGQ